MITVFNRSWSDRKLLVGTIDGVELLLIKWVKNDGCNHIERKDDSHNIGAS